MRPDDAQFRDLARTKALQMRRVAYLLCGDWHLAEDLVQSALLRRWIDESRRPWRRTEQRDGVVPDVVDPALGVESVNERNL